MALAGTVLAWLAAAPAAQAEDPARDAPPADARTLLQQTYDNLYGDDTIQTVELRTGRPGGRGISYRLLVVRRQGEHAKSLIRFLAPPDVRDTSILVLEQPRRGDDIFVYLPAFSVTKRVGQFQRADAFFGTDLSYEDLEAKRVEDFDVQRLGEGRSSAGDPCVEVEARERTPSQSAYERMVLCIDPARPVAWWTDFYRDGAVVKRLEMAPESIRRVDGRWIPQRARMTSLAAGTTTELIIESHERRTDIPDRLFSTATLERGLPGLDNETAP